MINAEDYLALIKSLIALCPEVIGFTILREEVQVTKGLWRYRLTLKDRSFLEMFEFFEVQSEQVKIIKYSFHWQKDDRQLIKRWDNAAHHPEIETYPHHLHNGAEDSVFPYQPVGVEEILKIVSEQINSSLKN
jgi:Family of unknown function (DUF6516)